MSRTMNRISRIFKAFLSLSLCFLLFALSACGQVQTETPDTPDSQSTPETVVSTPEAPETIVTPNEEEAPEEPEATDSSALTQEQANAMDTDTLIETLLSDTRLLDASAFSDKGEWIVTRQKEGAVFSLIRREDAVARLDSLLLSAEGDRVEALTALRELITGIPREVLAERIAFSQRISFTLPEGMTLGEYDAMLNYCGGGGVPLLKDEESCGQLELRYPAELNLKWNDDGSLAYIISVDNHAMFLEDFTALDTQQPGIYAEYSQDNAGSESGEDRFWYAFWGQQYGEIIYCLKVNAESMDRDAFVTLADSAVFADGAFHG